MTTLYVLIFIFFQNGRWTTNDFYDHSDKEIGVVFRNLDECRMFGSNGMIKILRDKNTPQSVKDTIEFRCATMFVLKDHQYGTD